MRRLGSGFRVLAPLSVAVLLFASCSSDHVESIPAYGHCEVNVTPANAGTTLARLRDPLVRVFCVAPGDYRRFGPILLEASGTSTRRRFLRLQADPIRPPLHEPARAIFEDIRILGSWWVVQGITVQPRDPDTYSFIRIEGGDYNVIDTCWLDGSQQANIGNQVGLLIMSNHTDPATYNTVQRNVVSNGNQRRLPLDYAGVLIVTSAYVGGNNDYNRVVENEIFNWGDGVALGDAGDDCNFVGQPHGTLIDGNDIYITANKRVRCTDGSPDPNGGCACAENGIDIKPSAGSLVADWTVVTNNRVWGYRPTVRGAASCGGSGSNGQAISAGNFCAGHVYVGGNAILDSTVGILPAGSNWIIAGNVFHGIRSSAGVVGFAIAPIAQASHLDVEFNVMVNVDGGYDDASSYTDARCNVVIADAGVNPGGGWRGIGQVTAYNYLYDAPATSFAGATNRSFATVAESRNTDRCFTRRRWTQPEVVCIPYAHGTTESPHHQAMASCDADLGLPFGMPRITTGY
jgi:hypothetical protein